MALCPGLVARLADAVLVVVGSRAGQGAEVGMVKVWEARVERLEWKRRQAPALARGDTRLKYRLAYGESGDRTRDWRAEYDDHGPPQAPGSFPQDAPAGIAEHAAPEVFQEHRHHRGTPPAGDDHLQPAVERAGQPVAGHLGLGEKAQDPSFSEHLTADFEHRALGFRAGKGHGDQADPAGPPAEDWPVDVSGIDQSLTAARAGCGEEEAVEPRHMVGGNQHRARLWDVLPSDDLQTVTREEQNADEALAPPSQREQKAGNQQQNQRHDAQDRQRRVHDAVFAWLGTRLSGRMEGQTSSTNAPVSRKARR